MMKLDLYSEHSAANVLPLVREIFFLSADPKNVSEDPLKNEAFFEKWAGYYFRYLPEWISLAWNDGKLLGYLMCAPDSQKALSYYQTRNASYGVFADQFGEFPAHLHMNSHPDARGQGVGTALVENLAERLKAAKIRGVHLITSPQQRNVAFYRKTGFDHEVQREWRGYPLLFMGKKV